MGTKKTLQKALQEMADGSKTGFRSFYDGTIQYIYSSAMLLYGSRDLARRFVVDFYQYLYLHLPEYDGKQDVEAWLVRLMKERYDQLSIGQDRQRPDPLNVDTQLDADSRERIYRRLEAAIHFPKEQARRRPLSVWIALALSVLLLLTLLAVRYGPALSERMGGTDGAEAAEDGSDAAGEELAGGETGKNADGGLSRLEEEIGDMPGQTANGSQAADTDDPDSSSGGADGADSGDGDGGIIQSQSSAPQDPDEPREPDEPQTPGEPDVPDVPLVPDTEGADGTQTDSGGTSDVLETGILPGAEDLEDLELHMRYGGE